MCKVTIAIPVYNVEEYIEKSLLSALDQTFDDIEFLIVDDKGNDGSIDIVKRLQSTHPRGQYIRIIDHLVNRGVGATRNTAIEKAKGDYLFFMDSDDTIEPDTISVLYNMMIEHNVNVVEGSYQICSIEDYVFEKHIMPQRKTLGDFAICRWMKDCRLYYDGYGWNKLFNLAFLRTNNIRCIDNHRHEDVYFSFQVVFYAKSIITVPNITYNYLMRPGSTVNHVADDSYYNQYLEIFNARTSLMRRVNVGMAPNTIYNYYLQHFFEWWLRFILTGHFSKQKKQFFYKVIQEIFTLDFTSKNLIGFRYKVMYNLMKCRNYKYIKIYLVIDIYIAKIYNRINRHLNIFKLPYSHL